MIIIVVSIVGFGLAICSLSAGWIWLAWQQTKSQLEETSEELLLEKKLRYIAEQQALSYSTHLAEMAGSHAKYPRYVMKFWKN